MNDLPVARCGDCLYWERLGDSTVAEDDGDCRLKPLDFHSRRLTLAENWCGEFIHRELGGRLAPNSELIPASSADEDGVIHWHPIKRQWRFPTEEG